MYSMFFLFKVYHLTSIPFYILFGLSGIFLFLLVSFNNPALASSFLNAGAVSLFGPPGV